MPYHKGYVSGHKDSKGHTAPYVVKNESGKIVASAPTAIKRDAALRAKYAHHKG